MMKYNLVLSGGESFLEHEYELFKELSILISKLWETKFLQKIYLLTCGYGVYSKYYRCTDVTIPIKSTRQRVTIYVEYDGCFLENLSAEYEPYVQTTGFQENKKQFVVCLDTPGYCYRIIFNFNGEFLIVNNYLKDQLRSDVNCRDTKVFHVLNTTYKKVLPTYLEIVSKCRNQWNNSNL